MDILCGDENIAGLGTYSGEWGPWGLDPPTFLTNYINKADCFTIVCDKTLDVSGIKQLSLCARYINFKNQLREDFLFYSSP